MKTIKQMILRLFFAIEIVVFLGVYILGPQGIQAVHYLKKEHECIIQEVNAMTQEIQTLKNTITAWKEHPFYKEKIAREQLQMARKDDQVYYLT